MTPAQLVNPVLLETAILSLRRGNPSAVGALIEALKAEEEYVLGLLLSETSDQVRNRQGMLCALRGLRTRVEGAEERVDEFRRRETQTAQHRAQGGRINP